jgi:hypothetical protein
MPNVNLKIGSNPIPVTKQTKKYDTDKNGVLEGKEIAAAVAHGLKIPKDQVDVAAAQTVGAPVVYNQEASQILNTYAPNWKGDFNVPGRGAGNIHTGRDFKNGHDALDVVINCDLMEKGFLEGNVKKATLVVMPKGNDDLQAEIPLQVATAPGYTSYNRGGGNYSVPDKKFLAASIDTASLRDFGGNKDLKFYVRIETKDNQTLWINKDGKAYSNFDISKDDLKPQGNI